MNRKNMEISSISSALMPMITVQINNHIKRMLDTQCNILLDTMVKSTTRYKIDRLDCRLCRKYAIKLGKSLITLLANSPSWRCLKDLVSLYIYVSKALRILSLSMMETQHGWPQHHRNIFKLIPWGSKSKVHQFYQLILNSNETNSKPDSLRSVL